MKKWLNEVIDEQVKASEQFMKDRGFDPKEVTKWDCKDDDDILWEDGFKHGLLYLKNKINIT